MQLGIKGILGCCLIVISLFFGQLSYAENIGVVDSTRIFSESKIGQAGFSRLLSLQQKAEAELLLLEERIDALEESAEDKEMRKQIEFQGAIYTLQGALDSDQEAILGVIQENLNKAMEQVRKEKKLTVIFAIETLLSFEESADVTSEIIKLLDAMPVNFPAEPIISLPEPAAISTPEAAPASDAAAATK